MANENTNQPQWLGLQQQLYPPSPMEHLPPGFRFYPTEEELVSFYLLNKLEGKRQDRLRRVIPEIDICSTEPWDLPKVAGELCQGDTEQWFFFTPRQEREARGGRPSRTTASGYWKATGSPGYVYSSDNRVIGVKKTMVFYKGKAPSEFNPLSTRLKHSSQDLQDPHG